MFCFVFVVVVVVVVLFFVVVLLGGFCRKKKFKLLCLPSLFSFFPHADPLAKNLSTEEIEINITQYILFGVKWMEDIYFTFSIMLNFPKILK